MCRIASEILYIWAFLILSSNVKPDIGIVSTSVLYYEFSNAILLAKQRLDFCVEIV